MYPAIPFSERLASNRRLWLSAYDIAEPNERPSIKSPSIIQNPRCKQENYTAELYGISIFTMKHAVH